LRSLIIKASSHLRRVLAHKRQGNLVDDYYILTL